MIRLQFFAELEELYTDPRFPAGPADLEALQRFSDRPGTKLQAYRILTDKLARIATDFGVDQTGSLRVLYDALLVGWERYCAWA